MPPAEAFEVLRHADLALIPLGAGVHRTAHPSKTMTCLTAGCRLLVIMERESELVAQVEAADVGSWCPQRDAAAMAAAIRREAARGVGAEDRARAVAFAEAEFGREPVLNRWAALVAASGAPGRSRR